MPCKKTKRNKYLAESKRKENPQLSEMKKEPSDKLVSKGWGLTKEQEALSQNVQGKEEELKPHPQSQDS